jgi:hypothetical protein
MNRFEAWEARNLAKFAQEATARLTEQEALIESLQADLKAAIRAYRHLVIEGAKNDQGRCTSNVAQMGLDPAVREEARTTTREEA